MKFEKSPLVSLFNLKLFFSLFCGLTLREHYLVNAIWSVITGPLNTFFFTNFFFYLKVLSDPTRIIFEIEESCMEFKKP